MYITQWNSQGFSFIENIEVEPETVGRCTGLRDKNCALIFEGDIVECYNWEYNIFHVFYSEHFQRLHLMPLLDGRLKNDYRELRVHIFDWISPDMKLSIIGNIHDNRDLLESGGDIIESDT